MLRALVLVLTVVTGFTGLAYEVTWQKYLGVLLGAHSEATASVLGLFLGGLSIGYWMLGALTQKLVERGKAQGRPAPLLFVYGCIEGSIGLYCLLFPLVFPYVLDMSVWLPTGSGLLGFAVDVVLAALLILPPAMLMGGTIPILTQALARSLDDATRFHAFVYAFNTVGAFFGAIAAGFFLIPLLGLDGVLHAMGFVNIVVGATFAILGLRRRELADLDTGTSLSGASATSIIYGGAALLIGFAMMTVQTTLVRLGGLSFGSSEYTFSMVVAVFVLCIAIGSLVVGALPNIGRAVLPATLWSLAAILAALYVPLGESPYWGHLIRVMFQSHDPAFGPFHIAALIGVLVAIGPAVVLSGAVLPLLFHAMRREIGDLGAQAGRLYSVNTVGSLLGALVGGYVLLAWLDLTHIYRIALAAVIVAAVLVSSRIYPWFSLPKASGVLVVALISIVMLPAWKPSHLMPGLIRERVPTEQTWNGATAAAQYNLIFYQDDPTSSVGISQFEQGEHSYRSLIVNGKSDGSTRRDLGTMVLLGIVPALFAEKTERAFVIGYGLGVSVGELAELDKMREVQVAEISSAVVEAAPLFDHANHGASQHPKVTITRSDAYRTLLRSTGEFDIIVSEPSNPWVTGVEMLYTREFLEAARDRLAPGGVYAQWYHVYETDDATLELVLRTYTKVFEHVAVWRNNSDMLLLGLENADPVRRLAQIEQRMRIEDYQRALVRIGIKSPASLLVHEVLPVDVAPLILKAGPVQTLYQPLLSHHSARAFFRGDSASLPFSGFGEAAQVGTRNSLLRHFLGRFEGAIPENTWNVMLRRACANGLRVCASIVAEWERVQPDSEVQRASINWARAQPGAKWINLIPLLRIFLGHQMPHARVNAANASGASEQYDWFYSHAIPFQPKALSSIWQRCDPEGRASPDCERGLTRARRLEAGAADTAPRDW